jgi:tight adherence protein B
MSLWLCAVAAAALVLLPRRDVGAGRRLQRLGMSRGGSATGSEGVGDALPVRAGWVAVLAGSGLVAAGMSVPVVLVGLVTVLGAQRGVRRHRDRRRLEARRNACVEVAVALAGELRAGRSPVQALGAVAATDGPLRSELASAAEQASAGSRPSESLRRFATMPGAARLGTVAAVWSVAESAGARVADVMDSLAAAMDADDRLRGELDAELAGPRATVVVLAALPVMGLLLGQAVGAHPLHLLLHRRGGWALLAVAALLDLAGVAAIRAITDRAMPP